MKVKVFYHHHQQAHISILFRSPTRKCQIVPAIVESKPSHFCFREPKQRCVENLILVWYDPNLNSDEDERQVRKTISEL
jgi:hypothetical protein